MTDPLLSTLDTTLWFNILDTDQIEWKLSSENSDLKYIPPSSVMSILSSQQKRVPVSQEIKNFLLSDKAMYVLENLYAAEDEANGWRSIPVRFSFKERNIAGVVSL